MELLTRPAMRLTLHEERDLHNTGWGYHFARCRMFPTSGAYKADEMDPLTVVLLDATDSLPTPSRVERPAGALVVVLPRGRRVIFKFVNGEWQLDLAATAAP